MNINISKEKNQIIFEDRINESLIKIDAEIEDGFYYWVARDYDSNLILEQGNHLRQSSEECLNDGAKYFLDKELKNYD